MRYLVKYNGFFCNFTHFIIGVKVILKSKKNIKENEINNKK